MGLTDAQRCKNCRHFSNIESPPYGECGRWNRGYRFDHDRMPLNEVLVEDDEGWGMVVGPDFGCVLFEEGHSALADTPSDSE